MGSRFQPWVTAGWVLPMVDFVWCTTAKRRMRSPLVVPDLVMPKFVLYLLAAQGNQDYARAERFQRQNETFHHGDTAMFPHGAKTRPNASPLTPTFESATPELRALIANQVLGPAPASWIVRPRKARIALLVGTALKTATPITRRE